MIYLLSKVIVKTKKTSAEIDDVVIRRVRECEVLYLKARDRHRCSLGIIPEEPDPAGDLEPLALGETASDLVEAEKRDHADVVRAAGVGFSNGLFVSNSKYKQCYINGNKIYKRLFIRRKEQKQ